MHERDRKLHRKKKLRSTEKNTFEMAIRFIFSANIHMAKFSLPLSLHSGSNAAGVGADLCLVLLKAYIVHTIF